MAHSGPVGSADRPAMMQLELVPAMHVVPPTTSEQTVVVGDTAHGDTAEASRAIVSL